MVHLLELPEDALDRHKSFLLCDSYYKLLLKFDDLTALNALPNVYALTDDDYKEIMTSQIGELEALENRSGKESWRVQALRERKAARTVATVANPLAIMDRIEMPAILLKLPALDQPFTVCFDKFSHDTGNRRTFCYCPIKHPGVRRCRKYKFLRKFGQDTKEAAYYFAAWVHKGMFTELEDNQTHALHTNRDEADIAFARENLEFL